MVRVLSTVFGLISLLLTTSVAQASGIQWGGQYRVEGVWLDGPTLGNSGGGHRYGLHHLSLRPEIVPADRFLIRGQVEVFNSSQYPEGNTLGEFWGGTAHVPSGASEDPFTLRGGVDMGFVAVSQLYLQWFQDFGTFTVGRAPLNFGLGMSYSAGDGPWDHWMSTRDLLSYTIQMGNFSITPTYAKLSEGRIQSEDDVNEYLAEIKYENEDTGLSGGVLYRMRRVGTFGNDRPQPAGGVSGGFGEAGFEEDQTSFFFKRQRQNWSLGLELSFVEGKTGYTTAAGSPIDSNGFGLAAELTYQKPDSRWQWFLKGGLASGDDPATEDAYEGFIFHRNYDVSLLLFNHVMGARGTNLLGTGGISRAPYDPANDLSVQADVESLSNAFYISPQLRYRWSERWNVEGRLTYASLQNTQPGWEKDLGYELDILTDFAINSRVTWRNGFAFLFPGQAFTGLNDQYSNSFAFGWISQAAIQF